MTTHSRRPGARRTSPRNSTGPSFEPARAEPLEARTLLANTIAGSIYTDVNGNGGRDPEDTAPRAGVLVTLYDRSVLGVETPIRSVKTDSSGVYTFAGLIPPGSYSIRARVPRGNIQTTYSGTIFTFLSGADGVTSGVDVGLFKLITVTGTARVIASEDATIPVRAPGSYALLDRFSDGTYDATAIPSPDGTFTFPNVGPGSFTVKVLTPNASAANTFRASSGTNVSNVGFGFSTPSTPIVVTSLLDAGPGTLRQAIALANSTPQRDIITFDPALDRRTIFLTSGGLPIVTQPLTIAGLGPARLTIDGYELFRVFEVAAGISAHISGLTIAHAGNDDDGAGIRNSGDLILLDAAFFDCESNTGGGALSAPSGSFTSITRCTFTDNYAHTFGGAIDCEGDMTISDSTITGNRSDDGGGIGVAGAPQFTLTRSTVSDNLAYSRGGGVFTGLSFATITNSTICGNRALGGTGGGGVSTNISDVTIASCTIVDNHDGSNNPEGAGGITKPGAFGTLRLHNTIVSNNSCGPGTPWTDVNPGVLSVNQSNFLNSDPGLAALADNSGPTFTRAPFDDQSILIDTGNQFSFPGLGTDQRGFPRVAGVFMDRGAVEINSFDTSPPSIAISGASIAEGQSGTTQLTFTLTRSGDDSVISTVDFAAAPGTAAAGSDYQSLNGQVVFPAGVSSRTITISINADRRFEPDETLLLNLSNPFNASIENTQATGTITNDDVPPLANIIPDPFDASRTALEILGSPAADTIVVSPGPFPGRVTVTINGVSQGSFDFNARIIIHGAEGDDTITISTRLTTSAFIYGEDGNDTLKGGNGPDVLLGGIGDDKLFGRGGRDLLFGGDGANRLNGGDADDLLVAGATSFDLNSFFSLQSEWTRTGVSYRTRVSHIKNGNGLNAGIALNSSTISRGAALRDVLRGDAANDLFFVQLSGPRAQRDLLPDRVPGEVSVAIS